MSERPELPRTIYLLGAGELGKELAVAAQHLGMRVIAADRYLGAPAMQVADTAEVLASFDDDVLEASIRAHEPDFVVLELESLGTPHLRALEADGIRVVPSAEAAILATDREGLRRVAAEELGLRVPAYAFADTLTALAEACDRIGYPCMVKPVQSTSGEGQTSVSGPARVEHAWHFATDSEEDTGGRVIVEEFVEFHTEITLLTVREWDGHTHFVRPIAHRQERGDYRESWMPVTLTDPQLDSARHAARRVTDRLGGAGVFGVEFFVTDDEVIFSEVSPYPHDTGLVTLLAQDLSQFELHLRAVLGLPIPAIRYFGPAASAVILAESEGRVRGYDGVERALMVETAQLRIFGKPTAYPFRRMGVALAGGGDVAEARARALEAASRVDVLLE